MKKHVRFSIRKKLLLMSVAVLTLPYIGYQYVTEMEHYLREGLEVSLQGTASGVSGLLNNRDDLFPQTGFGKKTATPLFIHPLTQVVQLDGYAEEWSAWYEWADDYEIKHGSLSARIIVGERATNFYVLFDIKDQEIVYQRPDKPFDTTSDQIELIFTDNDGELQHYWIAPAAPGDVGVYEQTLVWDEDIWEEKPVLRNATHIAGAWQESESGYTVELKIPKYLIGQNMGFIISDVDDARNQLFQGKLATFDVEFSGPEMESNTAQAMEYLPNQIVRPSNQIGNIIKGQQITKGRRIWVLDFAGHVLATQGELRSEYKYQGLDKLYALILPSASSRFKDDLAGASRLRGDDVMAALKGKQGIRWRSSPDGKAAIVSAAQPVRADDQILGVVVAEETTGNIQTVQRKAMMDLFTRSLAVFIIVTALLLYFASQLSSRIRRLRHEADLAIDEHGRVREVTVGEEWQDELGDLSVHYSDMLSRLKQYNDYLESLASKLSHELRTPMSVVQSSLESLESSTNQEETKVYIGRAKEGVQRLQTLVTRLSEAARLEQALQSTDKEVINVGTLLKSCAEGYRQAYSQYLFVFEDTYHNESSKDANQPVDDIAGEPVSYKQNNTEQCLRIQCAPDLIVQMLDKLVSNAVDFSEEQNPITISLGKQEHVGQLSQQREFAVIQVVNFGPLLPQDLEEQLFGSLVSLRESNNKSDPHLGLGLYIARLIADFHHGDLSAANIETGDGVVFTIKLPLYG